LYSPKSVAATKFGLWSSRGSLLRSPRTLMPKNQFCNKSALRTRCRYIHDRLCLYLCQGCQALLYWNL